MRACVRACVCVCVCVNPANSLGQIEPVSWLKAASDKLKKSDNHSQKEGIYSTSITDISITLSDC